MNVIGGISFFLLGMMLMAEGLKAASGNALRNLMDRFTNRPISSIMTGTIVTNITQSSTSTSIMTIGFVNAGLMTFAQSIGIIFGANLGSTSTAWLVAFLGVKFSISQLALPMVALGVILMLFSATRLPYIGKAVAGFGVLFFGIQLLQHGMEDLNGYLNFAAFSGSDLFGRLILVIIGIVLTIIMQSSTAAVATIITMLSIGSIGLEQAIALVIGANIGTTATSRSGRHRRKHSGQAHRRRPRHVQPDHRVHRVLAVPRNHCPDPCFQPIHGVASSRGRGGRVPHVLFRAGHFAADAVHRPVCPHDHKNAPRQKRQSRRRRRTARRIVLE